MLVLTRRVGQQLRIADTVVITVLATEGRRVSLGIEAPLDVAIWREELVAKQLEFAAVQDSRPRGQLQQAIPSISR